jgi:hypothetical protein
MRRREFIAGLGSAATWPVAKKCLSVPQHRRCTHQKILHPCRLCNQRLPRLNVCRQCCQIQLLQCFSSCPDYARRRGDQRLLRNGQLYPISRSVLFEKLDFHALLVVFGSDAQYSIARHVCGSLVSASGFLHFFDCGVTKNPSAANIAAVERPLHLFKVTDSIM